MTNPFLEPTKPRYVWAVFAAILLFAGAVRFNDLSRHPMWFDDFFTLATSNGVAPLHVKPAGLVTPAQLLPTAWNAGPWSNIWTTQGGDVHPTLFYFTLRAWRCAFGESDFVLRSLSVTCSLVAIG